MRAFQRAVIRHYLTTGFLFVVYLVAMHAGIDPERRIGIDEYGWVVASHETYELLNSERRFEAEAWSEGFLVRPWGSMNPNVGKIVMGAALAFWSYDLPPPGFFPEQGQQPSRWGRLSWEERERIGSEHRPFVVRTRYLILTIGGLAAALVFFVARAMVGPVAGVFAFGGYVLSPVVVEMSFTVFTDNILLLFSLLATLAAVNFCRWWSEEGSESSRVRAAFSVLWMSLCFALAVGTKANGALVAISAAIASISLWLSGSFRRQSPLRNAVVLGSVALLSVALFVLFNPQLYENVPERIGWMMGKWDDLISTQQQNRAELAVQGFGEKLRLGATKGLFASGPFAYFSTVPAMLLCGAGFGCIVWRCWRQREEPVRLVGSVHLLVYCLVIGLATILWLPMDWTRYYLPLVTVGALLQSVVLDLLWTRAREMRRLNSMKIE